MVHVYGSIPYTPFSGNADNKSIIHIKKVEVIKHDDSKKY